MYCGYLVDVDHIEGDPVFEFDPPDAAGDCVLEPEPPVAVVVVLDEEVVVGSVGAVGAVGAVGFDAAGDLVFELDPPDVSGDGVLEPEPPESVVLVFGDVV